MFQDLQDESANPEKILSIMSDYGAEAKATSVTSTPP